MIRCKLFGHRRDYEIVMGSVWHRRRPSRHCGRCGEFYFEGVMPLFRWVVIMIIASTFWVFAEIGAAHDFGMQHGEPTPGTLRIIIKIDGDTYWAHIPRGEHDETYSVILDAVNEHGSTCAVTKKYIPSESCSYDVDGSGNVMGNDRTVWTEGWVRNLNTPCVRGK